MPPGRQGEIPLESGVRGAVTLARDEGWCPHVRVAPLTLQFALDTRPGRSFGRQSHGMPRRRFTRLCGGTRRIPGQAWARPGRRAVDSVFAFVRILC
jgi:hypothetical protein